MLLVLSALQGCEPQILDSPGECAVRPGLVRFDATDVIASDASDADERDIRDAIRSAWEAYLRVDERALARWLTDDSIRMSGRWGAGAVQRGAEAIAAGLAAEAEAYERGSGVIDQEHLLSQAEIHVDGDAATVVYWDTGKSGYRWCGEEQGAVVQVLVKDGHRWRIAHWTDSFSSGYDLERRAPGRESFRFDFSYPVRDLERAIAFYAPLLGEPEARTADRASFVLPLGSRFVLDASGLQGIAQLTPEMPNGWATLQVEDVQSERDRLLEAGVTFIDDGEIFEDGVDRYVIGLDEPDHNPFVLVQRGEGSGPAPATPSGLEGEGAGLATVRELTSAWVNADAEALAELYGERGRLYDDTRVKTRGFEVGPDLAEALQTVYWPRFDRSLEEPGASSPYGRPLSVQLQAVGTTSRVYGDRIVVSYLQVLTGTGDHPFRETALVTHLLDQQGRPLLSFTTTSDVLEGGRVLGPDYIGYPTTSVSDHTEDFYTDTMAFGAPYVDRAYRGWWSDNDSVYGTYGARPERDGLPRPGQTSAYDSFWVRSAEDTLAYLESTDARFPVIPAITGHSGLQRYRGYAQVVATDSEGNVVLFTEYTGE